MRVDIARVVRGAVGGIAFCHGFAAALKGRCRNPGATFASRADSD
jgi:hypothetical protein